MEKSQSKWNLSISVSRESGGWVNCENIYRAYRSPGIISLEPEVLELAGTSREILERCIHRGDHIYGVTTGFGDDGTRDIPEKSRLELQEKLVEFHGAGSGPLLSPGESRAVFLCRIVSLAQGVSAVRPEFLEFMVKLFNLDVIPVLPSRGSVGASGDLTPLSYLAAMLQGKRRAWFGGEIRDSASVLQELGITPWKLGLKEGLAVMNGTAMLTALAAISLIEARSSARWCDRISSMTALSLGSSEEPFDSWVHQLKHHPGSIASAEEIRGSCELDSRPISRMERMGNIQPRYSMRCAPQTAGVLRDTVDLAELWIEREINSANDNPLFDPETGRVFHTGNFYGGHIAAACDYLRIALSTSAQLVDRQIQLLLEGSGSLRKNLAAGEEVTDFGLKALGISTTALSAEIQHFAAPVSVLSRPTESGNQDVVSMGSVSSLKLREQLDRMFLILAHGVTAGVRAVSQRDIKHRLSSELVKILEPAFQPPEEGALIDLQLQSVEKLIRRQDGIQE
ncbi:HAL/PAL/TAL family ammonia-lyase [Salinispira pacifica]|uniref:Histidine ammonia-lyase n=1 Tax=Salinispira pacifica TaxID=1307761 RepID=V5WM86_9SPIO|nr:aromatic amino acid ammonia-lyase [Salinispira pacifica]AHC16753.1 Histidine ammonia-lyase [Salinispira pacifica]